MSGPPIDRAAVAAVDTGGMLDDILAQPGQLSDALWRVESAKIGERELPGGLLVCGMGGSAVGADLAAAALSERATRPLACIRGYAPPSWLTPDTLVLCSSYSGATEETLACFEAAGAAGASRVVLTTGGELAAAARAEGVPVIGVPSGMQPRAAVIYMTVGALECAALCGAAPSLREEIERVEPLLRALVEEWGPDSAEDSTAKELARRLQDTVPVVHGAGPTAAVAWRWKTEINENAKAAAFASTLPEADHNEVCGWERGRSLAPLSAVFLESADQHPRMRERVVLTADLAAEAGAEVARVTARGDSPLERVLSLVLLGDLLSVYLAVLEGVDPTPVAVLDRLKAALG
jgi:glucose/mannose-6-phosphate isomerase